MKHQQELQHNTTENENETHVDNNHFITIITIIVSAYSAKLSSE
jgi:hypothetical protein